MIVLSWNCRGLARTLVKRALHATIKDTCLDVIFLSKTKIPFSRISKMVKYMGFYNYEFFDSRGRKERLVVGWKCGVDIKVIFKSKNMVNCLVFSYPINEPWLLSLVYGRPRSVKRSCYGKQ